MRTGNEKMAFQTTDGDRGHSCSQCFRHVHKTVPFDFSNISNRKKGSHVTNYEHKQQAYFV
jgi:hypothetical protein